MANKLIIDGVDKGEIGLQIPVNDNPERFSLFIVKGLTSAGYNISPSAKVALIDGNLCISNRNNLGQHS